MPKYKSRLDKRAKKKSNVILNSMIAIVLVLIIAVGATIFLGNDDDRAAGDKTVDTNEDVADSSNSENEDRSTESESEADGDTEESEEPAAVDDEASEDDAEEPEEPASTEEESSEEDKPVADGDELTDEEENEEEGESSSESKERVVKESDKPNVKKVIVDQGWKPVGTVQTGEHVYVYEDTTHPDWQEKLDAFSYATGLSRDNMTVWWVERNGSDHKAIGTVAPNDQSTTYRVYIQWVDGKGWKPVKMEELVENDQN